MTITMAKGTKTSSDIKEGLMIYIVKKQISKSEKKHQALSRLQKSMSTMGDPLLIQQQLRNERN